jgi:hypothetical protein
MQRGAARVRRRDRDQHVLAQALHRVQRFVQPARCAGVAVAQQELHALAQHQFLAGLEAVRDHVDRPQLQPQVLLQPLQPARKERQRQHMGGGKTQAAAGLFLRFLRPGPGLRQAQHHVARLN